MSRGCEEGRKGTALLVNGAAADYAESTDERGPPRSGPGLPTATRPDERQDLLYAPGTPLGEEAGPSPGSSPGV